MTMISEIFGKRKNAGYLFIIPALVGTFFLIIFPLVYTISMGFKRWDWGGSAEAGFIGFANYISILTNDPLFTESLIISLVYVLVAVSIEFILGFGIALLINSISEHLVGFFRTMMVFPWAIPPIIAALAFRVIYHPTFGILNYWLSLIGIQGSDWTMSPSTALLAIIVADIWRWTPFVFLILTAGLQSMPIEPLQAARIDGASPFQVFIYLTIPMLKGVIIISLLLRSIDAFQAFDMIYMITKGGPGTTTQTLNMYTFLRSFEWAHLGYGSALAVIMMVIVFAGVILVERLTRLIQI